MLVTLGSQAAGLSVGSMTEAPRPRRSGRPRALRQRLAQGASRISAIPTFSLVRPICPTRSGWPSRSPRPGLNSSNR